jgi:hypothetical protein
MYFVKTGFTIDNLSTKWDAANVNQKLGWYVYVKSVLFIVTGVVCQKAKLERDSSGPWQCPGHVTNINGIGAQAFIDIL